MALKSNVMRKHRFGENQYREFATGVGVRIGFNRKMGQLAAHYGRSIFHLSQLVDQAISTADPADPLYMISTYCRLLDTHPEDTTIDGIIAAEVMHTTERSFRRHGDVNCLSPAIRTAYIRPDGTPLDVQAMYMTDISGQDITPDDIFSFMTTYERGPGHYTPAWQHETNRLALQVRDTTGVNITPDFAARFSAHFLQLVPEANRAEVPF